MGDLAKQVDVHVGHLIRKQRILVGLTHRDLAAAIGLSCEQIHKYESGILRISAGQLSLHEAHRGLRIVPIQRGVRERAHEEI